MYVVEVGSQNKIAGLVDEEYNNFMYKDKYGFLWISSSHHLNRYDGKNVRQYKSNIEGNWIQGNIIEDNNSNIWSSTYEYLIRYERATDSVTSFQLSVDGEIINDLYHVIAIDQYRNLILLKAGKSLLFYNDETGQVDHIVDFDCDGRRFSVIKTEEGLIKDIIALPTSEEYGYSIYNLVTEKEWRKKKQSVTNIKGVPVYFYEGISNNNSFLTVTSDGIYQITNEKFEKIGTSLDLINLTSITFLDSDNFLILDDNGSIIKFNYMSSRVENVENPLPIGEVPLKIQRFGNDTYFQSSKGGVWGIQDFNNKENKYISKIEVGEVYGISNSKDEIIVASSNSVVLISPESAPVKISDNDEHLKYILKDDDGLYWGYKISDIYRSDSEEMKWENCGDLEIGRYNSIQFSARGKVILSSAKGSFILERKDGLCNLTTTLSNENIHEFYVFQNGASLIVTNDNVTKYCYKGNCQTVIEDTYVFSLSVSEIESLIFLNTRKGIISCSQNGIVKPMTHDILNGIELEVYTSIENDSALYLSTSSGFYKYNYWTNNQLMRIDDVRLNSINLTSRRSLEILTNGDLYVGSTSGLLYVHPDSLEISVDRQYIDNIGVNSVFQIIDRSKGLFNIGELKHNENNISISSSIPNFSENKCVRLKYKIDSEIYYYKTGETAYFNGLLPGNYDILVEGFNSSNLNLNPYRVSFTILPPYYQTWWFRSLSVLSLLGLGFGINFGVTQRKLKAAQIELDKQKALSSQREKIADDLHDELGTELSKILYLSDEAVETKDESIKTGLVKEITNLAAGSISNMRDMLWVLDQKNDSLENLAVKIRGNVMKSIKEYPIEAQFDFPSQFADESIAGEIRKEILLIVKEAIHNIIKHSKASIVTIGISHLNETLKVVVADNGIGIPSSNEYAGLGRGLGSMRKRAEKIGGELSITNADVGGVKVLLAVAVS